MQVDPRQNLDLILFRVARGSMPKEAGIWAKSALSKAEEIFTTMESMENNGKEVPTDGQDRALRNINCAACNWLHKEEE